MSHSNKSLREPTHGWTFNPLPKSYFSFEHSWNVLSSIIHSKQPRNALEYTNEKQLFGNRLPKAWREPKMFKNKGVRLTERYKKRRLPRMHPEDAVGILRSAPPQTYHFAEIKCGQLTSHELNKTRTRTCLRRLSHCYC